MSALLAVRTNQNGRRTVHLPLRFQTVSGRTPLTVPTRCGWYGWAVYSSPDDTDLADAIRCRRCFTSPEVPA